MCDATMAAHRPQEGEEKHTQRHDMDDERAGKRRNDVARRPGGRARWRRERGNGRAASNGRRAGKAKAQGGERRGRRRGGGAGRVCDRGPGRREGPGSGGRRSGDGRRPACELARGGVVCAARGESSGGISGGGTQHSETVTIKNAYNQTCWPTPAGVSLPNPAPDSAQIQVYANVDMYRMWGLLYETVGQSGGTSADKKREPSGKGLAEVA